ncbi:MAG TPA: glutamate synthase, partial [Candidatus Altiarchaeales archaeon]|nr:glutamate synthase [Candidatus Altiarchaeales archaeon]
GFLHPEPEGMVRELGLKLTDRGNILQDESKMTSVKGVFTAGDCARGQSLVVWAIYGGRRAAESIRKYLEN